MFDVTKLMENNQLQCTECSKCMAFILQIYCPVDNSSDERILYFFSCINKHCLKKKCRLFRVVTKAKQSIKMETKLFDDDWGDSESTTIDSTSNNHNMVETTIKCDFEKHSHFIPHYLSVIDEPNESIDKEKYEKMAKQIEIVEENFVNEEYEKHYPEAFKDDTDNYRFYKQIRKCPEQLVRYEWSGKPLKPSNKANIKLETCENCGSERVFELQFMPSLINVLLNNKNKPINDDISIDFETIMAYTCSKNCYPPNCINEEQTLLFKEDCTTLTEKLFEFIPEKKEERK